MKKQIFSTSIIASLIYLSCATNVFAQETNISIKANNTSNVQSSSEIKINLEKTNTDAEKSINLESKNPFEQSILATDKFVQCNISAAWEDFKNIIKTTPSNDFNYTYYANKMAELGFFDLANTSLGYAQDKSLVGNTSNAIKKYYFPKTTLKHETEMSLATFYSNIFFNDQSAEALKELENKKTIYAQNDYANYLMACAANKLNQNSKALKYINTAISQNSTNINYKILKTKILVENKKNIEAINLVSSLKKQNINTAEYKQKIASLEQYILYKSDKSNWGKNYHLGYYYYLEGDSYKAIRSLQYALINKKSKGKAYGLASEIYFNTKEYEKATETAKNSIKFEPRNPKALMTLGDISFRKKDYKTALAYYKKINVKGYDEYLTNLKEARCYQKLDNSKKAIDIYTKIMKTYPYAYEAYYDMSFLTPDKKEEYLKKCQSINLKFTDGWVELAKIKMDEKQYDLAEKYLSNIYYIDENNYRYYYYQGVLCQRKNDFEQAKYNYKKCYKINPYCKEAKEALDSLLAKEGLINE